MTVQLNWQPEGVLENVGTVVWTIAKWRSTLARFKELIESWGQESGTWRRSIGPNETDTQP